MTGVVAETQPVLLVVICTHNPRQSAIERTLQGLREQSLSIQRWDLLIIDNASNSPPILDLTWHSDAKVVIEPELGTIFARTRAFTEFESHSADLLLFVDDDTVLDQTYLERGLSVFHEDKSLGCWGGQLIAEYEVSPPAWFYKFANYYAVFEFTEDTITSWGSFNWNFDSLPPTAGMFTTKTVSSAYLDAFSKCKLRKMIGAKGSLQLRGEDTDYAIFAMKKGYQVARLKNLTLLHLIPCERLTLKYLEGLMVGVHAGTVVIRFIHEGRYPSRPSFMDSLIARWREFRLPEVSGRVFAAERRGKALGRKIVDKLKRV